MSLFFLLFLSFLFVGVLCDNAYYVIIPKMENTPDQNAELNVDINAKVNDENKVFRCHSTNTEIDTLYWWAPLDDQMKSDLLADHSDTIRMIEDITILAGGTDSRAVSRNPKYDRRLQKRDIIKQTENVPWHLKMVCQKPDLKLSDVDAYYYDDSAAAGIQIYIIDSGLRRSHQEFNDVAVTWLHAGPFPSQDENDVDQTNGHGTSMASAALGVRDGVAKRPDLTVVRADTHSDGQAKLAPLKWLDSVKQVYDDIKANHKGKAVVSMSWGFADNVDRDPQPRKDLNNALKDLFAKVLKPLIADLDAPAFVAAGNNAFGSQTVNSVPAVLADDTVSDLIVIGAVDQDGTTSAFSQIADFVTIYAPGEDFETATFKDDNNYEIIDGTSPATAMTAGLTAYFMGLGDSGVDARKKLSDLTHARAKNAPKVIWNGIDTVAVSGPAPSSFGPDPEPQDVDDGVLNCKAQHDDGDTHFYFNREGALAAIDEWCQEQADNKIIMGGDGGVALQESAVSDGHDSSLDFSMSAADDAIPLNFSKPDAVQTCKERFTNVVELCDTKKRSSDAWKQGGTFLRDGITYKLVVPGN